MKVFKFIIIITFMTILALTYVHQHVELVKLSYAIENNETRLKDMLDRKASLGYNIDNLEAPSRLEKVLLAERINIVFPKRGQVFRVAKLVPKVRKEERLNSLGIKKANILDIFEFFSPRAEAHGFTEK